MSTEQFDRRISRAAARQYGVFTRDQAWRLGATNSLIRGRIASGRWDVVRPGIYRIGGTIESWQQSLVVACLASGSHAAVSHEAAASLWSVPNFPEGTVEVTVPPGGPRPRGFSLHRAFLPSVDITRSGRIPVTTPARTLIDIAGVVEREVVEEALDDALRRRLVTRSRLRWRIDALAKNGRPGIAVIRTLLDARGDGDSVPQSVFETRLFRVLRGARLPRPVRQYEVRVTGRLVAVPDFAYPEFKVAIEADSYRWHSGRARWERDLARRNRLTALGWRMVHVTWSDLIREPETVLEAIERALRVAQP